MSRTTLDVPEKLGPGIVDTDRPCQGQPWMSKVVLRQMGHLGPGIVDTHKT